MSLKILIIIALNPKQLIIILVIQFWGGIVFSYGGHMRITFNSEYAFSVLMKM